MEPLSEVLAALARSRAAEAHALEQLALRVAQGESEARGPKLMSFTAVAAALGCNVSHVSRLAARGSLPVVRVTDTHRGQRISEADLASFVRQRRDTRGPRRVRAA